LIVLGGWQHRTSYLRIDESGAQFRIEDDRLCDPAQHLQAQRPLPTRGV
jgi:hypothetical protein